MDRILWHVELLGGLRAVCGDHVPHFETRKAASLLAYLAYYRDRTHPREVLAELLWPDEDVDATRDRLRQALAAIRRALEPDGAAPGSVLTADRSEVALCEDVIETDVERFVARLGEAERATNDPQARLGFLREAIDIYRGELMPGYYDSWVASERARLGEMFYGCLCGMAEQLESLGENQQALEYARRAVAADPLREEAYAAMMRIYAADGRIADAMRQYREIERLLREELGVPPSEATSALVTRLRESHAERPASRESEPPCGAGSLEPEGGAVPLDSPFYIKRPTDSDFEQAIRRNDSIVLVKGARQIGKTSLLARGLQQARENGARVVLTDFQKLSDQQLESAEALFYTLAESIADQLDLSVPVSDVWNTGRGWNVNFERFMRREVLAPADTPIVWGLDEIDRLFGYVYSKSVFGLFRAWHNERSLDPAGPWSRLTLSIAYATEAHLFISDLNQSPFNVGTRLSLEDFTSGEVAELNRRYGSPLHGSRDLKQFVELVGGHPYLVRRGLHTIADASETLELFLTKASRDDGVFGDHLRRMLDSLTRDETLCSAMRDVLQGRACPSPESFYRLRSAGLITGESETDASPRCTLYRAFLTRHLL